MHDGVDAVEALAEIGRHARDVPTKTKGNVFIGCAAEFEAEGGGDAV